MKKYLDRAIKNSIIKKLQPNKVVVILGARRVGKTQFLKNFINNQIQESYLFLNGEDLNTVAILRERSTANYKRLLGTKRLLVIDEAQKVPEIGLILKLMVDTIEGLKIIVTGSSVFDMTNKLGEPLTGRKFTIHLYPFAQMELKSHEDILQTRSNLEERLIYGSYPEVLGLDELQEKTEYLKEISSSYLLKDILEIDGIRNSDKMFSLLRLIAFQTGKEVSLDELGKSIGLARNTVERYLDLLSKVFIIFKVNGFSRNLRNEITKTNRWYFYDNGIKNVFIANFNSLNLRFDIGDLWENYIISERIKHLNYKQILSNNYFWRTYQQQEIDWIEEREGRLYAYEIKWNPSKKSKVPSAWKKAYPESSYQIISQDNYLDWIE